MLPHFGQTEPTESFPAHLEGIVAFLLFPFELLLVTSMKIVEGVLALAFGLGPQATEDCFDFRASLRPDLIDFGAILQQGVPNVPSGGDESAPVVVVEDRDDLHITKRLLVDGDPPQRP